MRKDFPNQIFGHFSIGEEQHAGIVTLEGSNSKIEIYSEDVLKLRDDQPFSVHGISGNGEKITACQCVSAGSGRSFHHDTSRAVLRLFPHHVALGPDYLHPNLQEIGCVSYTFPRAVDLFYDPATAGELRETPELRKLISDHSDTRADGRDISHALIFYWVNRGPIIEVVRAGTRIRAQSHFSYQYPSPHGIRLDNKVDIVLDFREPVDFEGAVHTIFEVQSFFNMLMQSKQPVGEFSVIRNPETKQRTETRVYIVLDQTPNTDRLDYRDFLISGGFNRKEFATVFANWLNANEHTRSARRRFLEGFCQRFNFSIDRFVGAANCFDLLPNELFARREPLAADIETFIDEAATKAKTLSDKDFRYRALNNIGRLKSINLAEKILQRYETVPQVLKALLPDASFALRQCVRTRNYFVHGSDPQIPLGAVYEFLPFFTGLLEFVFVAADLTELGWDAARWIKQPAIQCPIRDFLMSFESNLTELRKVS